MLELSAWLALIGGQIATSRPSWVVILPMTVKSYFKVHSQELPQQQIDYYIWKVQVFLSQLTEFHNSRVKRS